MSTCPTCQRTLVRVSEWRAMTPGQRRNLRSTHARSVGRLCEGCDRAERRGGRQRNFYDTAIPCPHCKRTTLSNHLWRHMPPEERAEIHNTHAVRVLKDGTCAGCAKAIKRGARPNLRVVPPPNDALAYRGGWVVRGGILRPTGEVA